MSRIKCLSRVGGVWLLGLCAFMVSGVADSSQAHRRPVQYVGVILGRGGLGDRSFNDALYEGLQAAQRGDGVRFETVPHTFDKANLEALRRFVRQKYDLIIGVGFENADYIRTLARQYPASKFASIDSPVEGDNVASIVFREHEGDFLMGVLAAMITKSKLVGFIGGMDIAVIRRIESGFRQGVAFRDPAVRIVSDLAGTFAKPEIGKSLALAQYAGGVDVIYNAAGRTGLGIIEAAREAGRLTIGTSGDQRYLAPGHVVGNRPKRTDRAVIHLLEEMHYGRFKAGIHSLGLKEGGISIGPFAEAIVTKEMVETLETLSRDIIAGKIVVRVPGE